ncbi:MAG: hypothetical protein ACI9NT_002313 [Bacteroidia bacterium]
MAFYSPGFKSEVQAPNRVVAIDAAELQSTENICLRRKDHSRRVVFGLSLLLGKIKTAKDTGKSSFIG